MALGDQQQTLIREIRRQGTQTSCHSRNNLKNSPRRENFVAVWFGCILIIKWQLYWGIICILFKEHLWVEESKADMTVIMEALPVWVWHGPHGQNRVAALQWRKLPSLWRFKLDVDSLIKCYGAWTSTGSMTRAGHTKMNKIWFLLSRSLLSSGEDRPIGKYLNQWDVTHIREAMCLGLCQSKEVTEWGGRQVGGQKSSGRWVVLECGSGLRWVGKGGGRLNLSWWKRRTKPHETIEEHEDSAGSLASLRHRPKGRAERDEDAVLSQNPISDPVVLIVLGGGEDMITVHLWLKLSPWKTTVRIQKLWLAI